MTPPLLPASAAPFAPRASSVSVVLGKKDRPWLTEILKGIDREERSFHNREEQRRQNRVKKPQLNNVLQQQLFLTQILSSPNAIWTLASTMLPKTPEADFKRDANPLIEAMMNYNIIHIEGYVVHIDMILRDEVTYKLTKDTIGTLIEYHKKLYRVDVTNTCDGEQQCKKLHEEFVQAINEFVLHTKLSALEGLEADGSGELLNGKSEEVKDAILSLMENPQPRVSDVTQQTPVFPKDNTRPPTALISALSSSTMLAATDYGVGMPLFEMGDSCSFCQGQCQECAATHAFHACLCHNPDDSLFSVAM